MAVNAWVSLIAYSLYDFLYCHTLKYSMSTIRQTVYNFGTYKIYCFSAAVPLMQSIWLMPSLCLQSFHQWQQILIISLQLHLHFHDSALISFITLSLWFFFWFVCFFYVPFGKTFSSQLSLSFSNATIGRCSWCNVSQICVLGSVV